VEPLVNALPYGFSRAKTAIRNLGIERDEERMPGWFGAMSPDDLESITALRPPRNGSDLALQFDVAPATSSLRRILYFDQTSWLPDNLLERGDRMTMAASIEARLPFLDHELVALASALPDRYRVRGATTKWILRRAAAEVLPKTILERPKVGFRLPVNEWFRGSMREYLRAHLCAPDSAIRSYLRTDTLDRRLKEHFEGRHNHEKLIWTLLNLEIWLRTQRSWVHL
jgi:asparagine synthase (glutamine-hydrolysing)